MAVEREEIEVDGRALSISNPAKIFFPQLQITKRELVDYYLAVGAGALNGCRDRPTIMKRFPNGITEDHFFQKRVPAKRPEWIQTARVTFPSMRTADFIAPADLAHVIWMVNLGCIDLNPWAVRKTDVDRPDELRVDLDPTPGIPFGHVRDIALLVREVLSEHGLVGFATTTGSRGMHIYARIEPRWEFTTVRRAALAFSREVERRDARATTAWWKEERTGVFLDYNMNARDRTLSSAYSVRPNEEARVACPLDWDEVSDVEPSDLTLRTVPARFAERGDPMAAIDEHTGSLDSLLELADRDEAGGLGDAPWPPHFPKARGEPSRVAPSRARKPREDSRVTRKKKR